jgi:hypothetical protein
MLVLNVLKGQVIAWLRPEVVKALAPKSLREILTRQQYLVGSKEPWVAYSLVAGIFLIIAKERVAVATPRSTAESIVRMTTPQYLPSSQGVWTSLRPLQTTLPGKFRPIMAGSPLGLSQQDTLDRAFELLRQRDPLAAIEVTLPLLAEEAVNPRVALLAAKAYANLSFFDAARRALDRAKGSATAEIFSDPAESFFVHLLSKDLKRANESLESWSKLSQEKDQGAIAYYTGVVHALDGRWRKARRSFAKVSWYDTESDFYHSAREYLSYDGRSTALEFIAGYQYSNNVLGVGRGNNLAQGMPKVRSSGAYNSKLRLAWLPIDSEERLASLAMELSYLDLGAKDLAPGSITEAKLLGDLRGRPDHKIASQELEVAVKPFAQWLGSKAHAQWVGFGAEFGVGIPTLSLSPEYILTTSQYEDQQPEKIEVYDPFRRQGNEADDLSWQGLRHEIAIRLEKPGHASWRLSLVQEDHHMRDGETQDQSSTETGISLNYKQSLRPWRYLSTVGGITKRSYAEGRPAHWIFGAEARIRNYFQPDFFSDFGLCVDRNTSSSQQNAYQRITAMMALGLVI